MDPKELRGLIEAYSKVYFPQEELGEAITSEKGKAKVAQMIAARSTPSGRAKPGKGANVAQIKHIGRANVDGYGGTPPNLKVAKNPVKSNFTGLNIGTGNKAARRAGTYQEAVDLFDTVLEFLQVEGYAETLEEAEWLMANVIDEEAIDIITELTGGKGHPGYKAGSRDRGPMQSGHSADSEKRKDNGGTMSQRYGDHLGDIDDNDDDEDGLETIVKQQSRDSRANVRKPLRNKVQAARKVLSKEQYVDESGKNDARIRGNIKSFGSNYTPPRDWDQSANRGQGAVLNAKQKEKQRRKGLAKSAMGEAVDLYNIILSHLIDEGYADTQEAANAIMANMSEDWRESIVETRMDPRGRPASGPMNVYGKSKPNTDPAFQAALKSVRDADAKKTPEQRKAELDAYKERQMNR
jgi:hypothetical protein